MICTKSKKLNFKNKYDITIYCILIISSALAALISVKNINLTADSFEYGLVSQQIISGNGLRDPIIWFDNNIAPIDGTVPFLLHPPLLPILLAILGGISPQSLLVAQILNLVCHILISVFTFLLMKNLCDKGIGLLAGILVAFCFPLLKVTHFIWSETLFIALTIASIYFLTVSRRSTNYVSSLNLYLAGACTSAAIFTRFAGIALMALFFWWALTLRKYKKPDSKYGPIIFAAIIPIITTAALFARNYMVSGMMRGSYPAPERSYLSAVAGTIKMTFLQFQLGERACMAVITSMILFILYFIFSHDLRKEMSKFFYSGLDLIIVFIISYTALICYVMAKKQTNFELRFMSPLVPFLIIISLVIVVAIWEIIKSRGFSKLSLGWVLLSLGLIIFGNFYKTHLMLPEFYSQNEKINSFQKSCTFNWIKRNYGKNVTIATNTPFYLSFYGGYSTLKLPSSEWDNSTPIPENMESILPVRMSKIGARVLFLYNEVKEQHYGGYISKLFSNREDDDSFVLVHECADGVVYNLKDTYVK